MSVPFSMQPNGFWVLVYVGSLIANCYLARKKNRSILGWFFLGVFFSFFSTIPLYFFPAKLK
ncbi:MAG: hypothetical protein HYY15_01280 [Candidatus Omnitrophica bacterium]|nr:hypothetical protein [Candidatus Omnitrophota bacterium]